MSEGGRRGKIKRRTQYKSSRGCEENFYACFEFSWWRERKSRDETTLGLCTEFLRPRLEKSENSARKVEG